MLHRGAYGEGRAAPLPRPHQAQDTGHVSCRCLLVPGARPGERRPWASLLASVRPRPARLLVPQDVQLLLALGEEALEAEVLPDDWQQLLQQLPLAQAHYR